MCTDAYVFMSVCGSIYAHEFVNSRMYVDARFRDYR